MRHRSCAAGTVTVGCTSAGVALGVGCGCVPGVCDAGFKSHTVSSVSSAEGQLPVDGTAGYCSISG